MDRQEKQAQFAAPPKKRGIAWPLIALAVVLAGAAGWLVFGSMVSAGEVTASGGRIAIPAATLDDGKARFFTYRHDGTAIRFFLLKSHDGVIRAALDTCDVCYREKKGYRQEGDEMVCNNCNQRFPSDQINEIKGGCNPAPIERDIAGGQVLLSEAELRQGKRYFQ
ncbi:MAG: DUF2318 domain-containing protein [Desulfuromonadales bacterium]|jgi:uncharacterized membrane protein